MPYLVGELGRQRLLTSLTLSPPDHLQAGADGPRGEVPEGGVQHAGLQHAQRPGEAWLQRGHLLLLRQQQHQRVRQQVPRLDPSQELTE